MRKLLSLPLLAVVLLLTAGFSNCANYEAARNFSTAQVKTQEQFSATLQSHFEIVEKFADAQLAVTNWRVDQITKGIQANYVKRTALLLDKDPSLTAEQKNKILADMASAVATDSAQNEMDKIRIAALVAQLKTKDAEIKAAYDEILASSRQLDEWVQLKKVDEVLAVRLTDKLKLSQDKLNKSFNEANDIWSAIIGLLPKTAPSTGGDK